MTRSRTTNKGSKESIDQKGKAPVAAKSRRRDSLTDRSPSVGLRQRVCFLCGDRCCVEETKLIRTRAGSCNTSTDVFPSLADKDPAPGAQPASAKGRVVICVPCYSTFSEGQDILGVGMDSVMSASPPHSSHGSDTVKSIATSGTPSTMHPVGVCSLCSQSVHELSFLETRPSPQDSSRPYFPCLLIAPLAVESRREDGRVLVCRRCSDSMMEKWKLYQRDSVPVENRTYELSSACYVCGTTMTHSQMAWLSSCQSRDSERYFPFLGTLEPAAGAVRKTVHGWVMACTSCRDCLHKQFDDFAADYVPLSTRIYRLPNGRQFQDFDERKIDPHSPPPLRLYTGKRRQYDHDEEEGTHERDEPAEKRVNRSSGECGYSNAGHLSGFHHPIENGFITKQPQHNEGMHEDRRKVGQPAPASSAVSTPSALSDNRDTTTSLLLDRHSCMSGLSMLEELADAALSTAAEENLAAVALMSVQKEAAGLSMGRKASWGRSKYSNKGRPHKSTSKQSAGSYTPQLQNQPQKNSRLSEKSEKPAQEKTKSLAESSEHLPVSPLLKKSSKLSRKSSSRKSKGKRMILQGSESPKMSTAAPAEAPSSAGTPEESTHRDQPPARPAGQSTGMVWSMPYGGAMMGWPTMMWQPQAYSGPMGTYMPDWNGFWQNYQQQAQMQQSSRAQTAVEMPAPEASKQLTNDKPMGEVLLQMPSPSTTCTQANTPLSDDHSENRTGSSLPVNTPTSHSDSRVNDILPDASVLPPKTKRAVHNVAPESSATPSAERKEASTALDSSQVLSKGIQFQPDGQQEMLKQPSSMCGDSTEAKSLAKGEEEGRYPTAPSHFLPTLLSESSTSGDSLTNFVPRDNFEEAGSRAPPALWYEQACLDHLVAAYLNESGLPQAAEHLAVCRKEKLKPWRDMGLPISEPPSLLELLRGFCQLVSIVRRQDRTLSMQSMRWTGVMCNQEASYRQMMDQHSSVTRQLQQLISERDRQVQQLQKKLKVVERQYQFLMSWMPGILPPAAASMLSDMSGNANIRPPVTSQASQASSPAIALAAKQTLAHVACNSEGSSDEFELDLFMANGTDFMSAPVKDRAMSISPQPKSDNHDRVTNQKGSSKVVWPTTIGNSCTTTSPVPQSTMQLSNSSGSSCPSTAALASSSSMPSVFSQMQLSFDQQLTQSAKGSNALVTTTSVNQPSNAMSAADSAAPVTVLQSAHFPVATVAKTTAQTGVPTTTECSSQAIALPGTGQVRSTTDAGDITILPTVLSDDSQHSLSLSTSLLHKVQAVSPSASIASVGMVNNATVIPWSLSVPADSFGQAFDVSKTEDQTVEQALSLPVSFSNHLSDTVTRELQ